MTQNTVNKSLPDNTNGVVNGVEGGVLNLINYGVAPNDRPAYYTELLDKYLRNRKLIYPYIGAAVAIVTTRLSSIPIRIEPRNRNVAVHQDLADRYNVLFADSWQSNNQPFIVDMLELCNGGFCEILDSAENAARPADQERIGFGGLKHIDGGRVTRTGNSEYPFNVLHTDGNLYKLHHTRVLDMVYSQSSDVRHNGTGYSPVLLCDQNLRVMSDVLRMLAEYMGSKPRQKIVLLPRTITAASIKQAHSDAKRAEFDKALEHLSSTLMLTTSLENPNAFEVNINELPDSVNEQTQTELTWDAIATAFSVDVGEFVRGRRIGETKADAEIQHLKTQSKMIGWFVRTLQYKIERNILPPTLRVVIDYNDDDHDQRRAAIREVQARTGVAELDAGVIDVRQYREQQLDSGHITPAQFRRLELQDGRLEDGRDIRTLFYSDDDIYRILLGFTAIEQIADLRANDPAAAMITLEQRLIELEKLRGRGNENRQMAVENAIYAVKYLIAAYDSDTAAVAEITAPVTSVPAAEDETTLKKKAMKNHTIVTGKRSGRQFVDTGNEILPVTNF